ncbi:MlaD family protein [Pontiellaceae bacterium B12219]|nr:MlaD family protein [Pontiellaceae bacterium B12219]
MSGKPHYFAIGLFVILATALGLLGVIYISSDAMRSPKYFLETYVDESVQGIDVGTPFKFRGVKVGNVSEIAMVSTVYDTSKMYVMIRVALDDQDLLKDQEAWQRESQEMIADGLRLKLVPQGITGLSFLEADFYPDTDTEPLEIDWEPKYIYIPSTPAMLTLLGRSVERVASEINRINIHTIGANVESITSNLNLTAEHIEYITRNAAGASDEVIRNIHRASDDLPGITSNLTSSIVLIQDMVLESGEDLDEVMLNLRYITEDTKELIRMIKRYPGILLTDPPKQTLGK